MVNFNFMTSQTGQYMITIHILPNKSRSISCLNQIKTLEIFFLKVYLQNMVGQLVSDPLQKIKTEHISGSTA